MWFHHVLTSFFMSLLGKSWENLSLPEMLPPDPWEWVIQPPTRFCANAWGGVLDHASDWDALPTSWHFITGMAQIPHTDVVAAWQWLLRVNLHRETWYFCSFDEGQFWPIYSWKDSAEPNSKTFHLQCCSNLHELVVFPSFDYHTVSWCIIMTLRCFQGSFFFFGGGSCLGWSRRSTTPRPRSRYINEKKLYYRPLTDVPCWW